MDSKSLVLCLTLIPHPLSLILHPLSLIPHRLSLIPRPLSLNPRPLFVTLLYDSSKGMKPMLDADFVAYLNYAIAQERQKILDRNLDPDREPTDWLQVLGVVRQGKGQSHVASPTCNVDV